MTSTGSNDIEGSAPFPAESPRSTRSFWSLIVTQFQGAFSDNILRNLLLSMIVGMGLARNERESFVSMVTLMFSVPFVPFRMSGGWLADRFSKRQITIWTKGMEIGSMVVATAGLALHSLLVSVLEKLLQCDLPTLWKPRSNQFFHVDALPVLGTGKIDLRGVKALAEASAVPPEAASSDPQQ